MTSLQILIQTSLALLIENQVNPSGKTVGPCYRCTLRAEGQMDLRVHWKGLGQWCLWECWVVIRPMY
jgi:hypothetical protein